MIMELDTEYQEIRIKTVKAETDGWSMEREDGWTFWCPKNESGIIPKAGDLARFYGRGIGSPVRGLSIKGLLVWESVFYETADEYHERIATEQAQQKLQRIQKYNDTAGDRQTRYDALPVEFQQRIIRFHRNNPDFWDVEDYEMAACQSAVEIARAMKTPDEVQRFAELKDFEQQKVLVPTLDDGLSGNMFGAACRLAWLWLSNPELVDKEHGAMCPLLGCKAYGCYSTEVKSV